MKIGEAFKAWKEEHPTAYKRALFVALGVVIAVAGMAWWTLARGATMTLDCPGGQFVATTGTLTCVQSTTTPPGGGGGGTTPPPVTDFDGCPANAVKLRNFYPVPSGGTTPYASPGQWMSIKMPVPAGAPMGSNLPMQFQGTYSGSPSGYWALSEKACTLDSALVDTINSKPGKPPKTMSGYYGGSIYQSYNYGPVGSQGVTKIMEVGKTYYLNIRFDECSGVSSCGFENVRLP